MDDVMEFQAKFDHPIDNGIEIIAHKCCSRMMAPRRFVNDDHVRLQDGSLGPGMPLPTTATATAGRARNRPLFLGKIRGRRSRVVG
jgi:hypothetical protein